MTEESVLPRKKKLIGEKTYIVQMLPFEDWQKLQLMVFPLVGASLDELAQSITSEDPSDSEFLGAVAKTLANVLPQVDAKKYKEICSLLGDATRIEGSPGYLDIDAQEFHWAKNRYRDLWPWLEFALRVQFEDFFEGLGLKIGGKIEQTRAKINQKGSLSQSTLTS